VPPSVFRLNATRPFLFPFLGGENLRKIAQQKRLNIVSLRHQHCHQTLLLKGWQRKDCGKKKLFFKAVFFNF